MPLFTYHGKNEAGEPVTERIEANDRFGVYEVARKNGHTVETVEAPKSKMHLGFSMERINALISRVKQDEIVMLSRNMAAMLKAGLALSRALSVSERQTKNPKLKSTLSALGKSISEGKAFHESLAMYPKVFSRLYIAMVKAGEESGKMSDALSVVSIQMERASNLKKKIRGAMTYPAIVLIVMFIIGFLMMTYVVPTLTATFKELNVDLPITTRIIVAVSDFLSNHAILAPLMVLSMIVGAVMVGKTRMGKRCIEWVLLRLPVIGTLVKETNAARTARTLSSLLSAGVDVVGALSITTEVVQNSYYVEVVADAAVRVEKGKPLSEVFVERTDLYPVLVGEMIAVGEETGQIAGMLLEVASFYENEVERKTKDLSTIIEPVLMVTIGAGVGFFALAMITPIYSISDSIG